MTFLSLIYQQLNGPPSNSFNMKSYSFFQSEDKSLKEYQIKYLSLYWILALMTFVLAGRLWYLQLIKGEEFYRFSLENHIKKSLIPSPRGLIYDRNHEVLVDNLPGFEAVLYPQYIEKLRETSQVVGKYLSLSPPKIVHKIQTSIRKNGLFFPVKIKGNLNRREMIRLKKLRIYLPGLNVRETIVRRYLLKEQAAQMFGYVSEISKKEIRKLNKKYPHRKFRQGQIVGKSGFEQVFEEVLAGQDGVRYIQVDAKGKEIYLQLGKGDHFHYQEPLSGKSLLLTIDKDIQIAAYRSLERRQQIGSVVVINPQGEILALANTPSFDPNLFSRGISKNRWKELLENPHRPLRNKGIQAHIAPGSAFKPFVALAALEEKTVKPYVKQYSPGWIRFGKRIYHDHVKYGHGEINLLQAIERSSNVYFYRLGMALTVDNIFKYARLFGFGEKTGIELPQEVSGLLPSRKWKLKRFKEAWQPGENLSLAIGQSFILMTPLQMAVAYNGLATRGRIYQPFLVKKIFNRNQQILKEFLPLQRRDLQRERQENERGGAGEEDDLFNLKISKSSFDIIHKGLWLVNNGSRGTARWWKIPGVHIAGKTGTSQVSSFAASEIYDKCESRPLNLRHHGWFIGYAPAEKPEITVAVLTEHSCHGSTGSAPIVRDVIRAYIKKYHPKRIKKQQKPLKKVTVLSEKKKEEEVETTTEKKTTD